MAPQLLTHSRAVLTRYVLPFVLLLLTKQQSVYIVGVGVNVFYIPYVSYFGSGSSRQLSEQSNDFSRHRSCLHWYHNSPICQILSRNYENLFTFLMKIPAKIYTAALHSTRSRNKLNHTKNHSYQYLWIGLLYWHLVYLVLKVLAWEICNIELEFAKKVIIQSQITITFYVWFDFLWILKNYNVCFIKIRTTHKM